MNIYKKLTPVLSFVLLLACHSGDLQKNGMPVSGTVIDKNIVITKRDFLYQIQAGFYLLQDDSGKVSDLSQKGKYISTSFYLNQAEYDKYEKGDTIELVYDKNDPEQVEIREEKIR